MVAELPAQTPFLWVLVRGTAPGLGPRAIETIKASRAIILFLACSCSSLCLQSSFSCVSPQREAAPELPVGGLGFGSSFVDQCVRDWSGSFYQCLWADSGGEPLVDSVLAVVALLEVGRERRDEWSNDAAGSTGTAVPAGGAAAWRKWIKW